MEKKKIPCIIEEQNEFDQSYIFKDAQIDSLNNLELSNISFDQKFEFQGNCIIGSEMLDEIISHKDRCNFQNINDIRFNGLGTDIDDIAKLNIPEGASVSLDGLLSIGNAENLSFLEKCNYENLGVLMPNRPSEFLRQIQQENKIIPNIPLMLEEDGIVKVVATQQKKEELIKTFGNNIGKAIYISPEEFSQETGIVFCQKKPKENVSQSKSNEINASHALGKQVHNLRLGINENLQPKEMDNPKQQKLEKYNQANVLNAFSNER